MHEQQPSYIDVSLDEKSPRLSSEWSLGAYRKGCFEYVGGCTLSYHYAFCRKFPIMAARLTQSLVFVRCLCPYPALSCCNFHSQTIIELL